MPLNRTIIRLFNDVRGVPPDLTDPAVPELFDVHPGDTYNLWEPDYDRGMVINELCSQYGLNKWDIIVWLMPWLAMGKKEGVLDDLDLGMEIDPSSEEFMKHLLEMIVYQGLLRKPLRRHTMIRELGKKTEIPYIRAAFPRD